MLYIEQICYQSMKMTFKSTYEDRLRERIEPILVHTLIKTITGIFSSTLDSSTSESFEKIRFFIKATKIRIEKDKAFAYYNCM